MGSFIKNGPPTLESLYELEPMPKRKVNNVQLAERSLEIRRMIIRMVHAAGCGHPGGPLGLADIFAVLYFDILRHRPKQPDWNLRDRLILSNGHVSAVRYATMKLAGYFANSKLLDFRKLGSPFQGHPSTRYLPELETSSGSLGQGLSAALGLSLGAKLQKRRFQVFACLSDGECGEGMVWEAATAAAHYQAPLIAFIDNNGIQIDGKTKDVCDLRDLGKKFHSFGWKILETDGHSIPKIHSAFTKAKASIQKKSQPVLIVFHTILGKGVSFMENNYNWHGKAPNDELAKQALAELGIKS